MVQRILEDNVKSDKAGTPRFRFLYNANAKIDGWARGQKDWLALSQVFDRGRHPGGEMRFALSLIHHEMGHTRFGFLRDHFNKTTGDDIHIDEERLTVCYFSNPVRIYHGIEPRYTYTIPISKETINIIDPSIKRKYAFTVKKDDPSIFANLGSNDARTW